MYFGLSFNDIRYVKVTLSIIRVSLILHIRIFINDKVSYLGVDDFQNIETYVV